MHYADFAKLIPALFGPVVASLSLGAPALMQFDDPATGACVEIDLQPRNLLILVGPARYRWRHGIAARNADIVDGKRRSRGRRLSLTFRTIA